MTLTNPQPRKSMLKLFGFIVITTCALLSPTFASDPEPECGVMMPHTTTKSSFDPVMLDRVFVIEGGIGGCTAVHIECVKQKRECYMVEVPVLKLGRNPELGPITLADAMQISDWTKDGLIADGKTHLCKRTQLTVDFAHQKVQLIATPLCPLGGPAVVEQLQMFPMFERKSPDRQGSEGN